MDSSKENKEMKESSNPHARDFNNRGQFRYLKQCHDNPKWIYSPMDIAMELDFAFWTSQVKQLLRKMESLEMENSRLCSKVNSLVARVSMVEGDNLSLRKLIQKKKEHETLHLPKEALHAEICDLKTKREEIRSQQASFK